MRPADYARMHLRSYAKDAQEPLSFRCQRVVDRLDEGWQIIWSVVVNKEDFVISVRQHFRDAVEAYCGAFVQVIPVRIVSAVQDNRYHSEAPVRNPLRSARRHNEPWRNSRFGCFFAPTTLPILVQVCR